MSLICDNTTNYWWTRCSWLQYDRSSSDLKIPGKTILLVALFKTYPSTTGTSHTLGECSGKDLALEASLHISCYRRHVAVGIYFVCYTKTKKDSQGQSSTSYWWIAHPAPSPPTGPFWSNIMSLRSFQMEPKLSLRDCLVVETSVRSLPPLTQPWFLYGVLCEYF